MFLVLLAACNSDKEKLVGIRTETGNPAPGVSVEASIPPDDGPEFFDSSKVYDGYILVNDAAAGSRIYLLDKTGSVVYEWDLHGKKLGSDARLMEDGNLLAMLRTEDAKIKIGGFGGLLAILNKDGNVEWSYLQSNENEIAHHDLEKLPNGNIMFLSWQKKSQAEAAKAGYSGGTKVVYDAVYEIDPKTNQIVWTWHMWDHLVQDCDPNLENFGVVAEHPERIDLNYFVDALPSGDISHVNGLSYDAEKDLIYLSANFYSEIWVIDHSTSSEEARGTTGGNFGRGGDLIYRFGNPDAYDNRLGKIRFDHNHSPRLLSGEKNGNILVFSNGSRKGQSTAFELKLPDSMHLEANTDNEPEEVWSFTSPTLFSGKVSGVELLPNGNRLITEGDFGFWEVTEGGEVVWKLKSQGFFWRGYPYDKDSPAIQALGL